MQNRALPLIVITTVIFIGLVVVQSIFVKKPDIPDISTQPSTAEKADETANEFGVAEATVRRAWRRFQTAVRVPDVEAQRHTHEHNKRVVADFLKHSERSTEEDSTKKE